MNEINFYIEFHWGKRRPNLQYFLNDIELFPTSINVVEQLPNQENIIIRLQADFKSKNCLEVKMTDKIDDDIVTVDGELIDHWVKIRQVELDQIKLDVLMYKTCSFSHSMSQEWVKNMIEQGYEILPCYPSGTDMRLNGVWSMNFELPIWEWCSRSF